MTRNSGIEAFVDAPAAEIAAPAAAGTTAPTICTRLPTQPDMSAPLNR